MSEQLNLDNPRILVVRLSAFGDCLGTLPALAALRRRFPNSQIGWAIEKAPHLLLRGHPHVDKFHIYPRHALKIGKTNLIDGLKEMNNFRKELAAEKYDIAIDFQGLTKSGIVAGMSRAKKRIGFRGEDSREVNTLMVNVRVRPPEEAVHVVDKNLSLLHPLGIEPPERPEWVMPDFSAEAEVIKPFLKECRLLDERGKVRDFTIVNPGATWYTKRYPPEMFGEVAKGLVERHNMPVISTWAGDDEYKMAETIVNIAGGPAKRAFIAPKTNLRELAALTQRAALFVGNDTGPLHLAVALKVHTVAIFGATDPLRNGAYGSGHRVQTGGVDCHPCWKTTCARIDRACLTWVKPEAVLTSCAHSLERRK